jgi:hypothetical protein
VGGGRHGTKLKKLFFYTKINQKSIFFEHYAVGFGRLGRVGVCYHQNTQDSPFLGCFSCEEKPIQADSTSALALSSEGFQALDAHGQAREGTIPPPPQYRIKKPIAALS